MHSLASTVTVFENGLARRDAGQQIGGHGEGLRGLGTPGTQQFLVGRAEAYDVLNSIRAAQQISDTAAGNRNAVWGHSQGGHSALWSAVLTPS